MESHENVGKTPLKKSAMLLRISIWRNCGRRTEGNGVLILKKPWCDSDDDGRASDDDDKVEEEEEEERCV